MSRINNTIKTEGQITTILVTKNTDTTYLKEVLIDTEDLPLLKKLRINNNGYAWSNKANIAHIIMGHTSNSTTVIDHINGNRLDNRKINLRVLSQHENATNKTTSKSNVGIVGISRRKNGNYEYFRATCSDLSTTAVEKGTYANHGKATKRHTKQFNISKLGENQALEQAKKWLSEKQKEFGYLSILTRLTCND